MLDCELCSPTTSAAEIALSQIEHWVVRYDLQKGVVRHEISTVGYGRTG